MILGDMQRKVIFSRKQVVVVFNLSRFFYSHSPPSHFCLICSVLMEIFVLMHAKSLKKNFYFCVYMCVCLCVDEHVFRCRSICVWMLKIYLGYSS